MTSRQIFESALVELNKVEAPSLLLEDFNYFFNKAIYQYVNKVYNVYDLNQQTTDGVRVLKSTAVLKPIKRTDSSSKLYGSFYEAVLPSDYYHMLNCICEFIPNKNFKCYNKNVPIYFAARRLTSDMWSLVLNNYFMRPEYKRPYYFIHNNNASNPPITVRNDLAGFDSDINPNIASYQTTKVQVPTNPFIGDGSMGNSISGLGPGTDQPIDADGKGYTVPSYTENGNTITPNTITNSNLSRYLEIDGVNKYSLVEKETGIRYGNASDVRIEIRYGMDDTTFKLGEIYVDYLKTPQNIRLTQDQIDLVEDTSQIVEFPDYVCFEIINELVKLLLENASDPRLNTNIPVNQSIAPPAQAMQQPQ